MTIRTQLGLIVLLIVLIGGWHLLCLPIHGDVSVDWLTDIVTMKGPNAATELGRSLRDIVGVPEIERQLSLYARRNLDIYAMLIPYRVVIVDNQPESTTVSPPQIRPTEPVQAEPSSSPAIIATAPPAEDWHVVSLETRIIDANSQYKTYSWKLTVKNESAFPAVFYGSVEFQDADGFKLEDDFVNVDRNIQVPATSEGVFTGTRIIDNATIVAHEIAKISKQDQSR
ncbi:MAG TPA: hypothetical protein VK763_05805 [Terriglobales bacterium]|jgi:hypothetical protein|nr:hypothetical protein [Terriglobales bacterium]